MIDHPTRKVIQTPKGYIETDCPVLLAAAENRGWPIRTPLEHLQRINQQIKGEQAQ